MACGVFCVARLSIAARRRIRDDVGKHNQPRERTPQKILRPIEKITALSLAIARRILTAMHAPDTLWRFPGPLALGRVLAGEPPTLHHPDAGRVFVGDDRLWSWPGVAEFGALTLFDAARYAPRPGPVDGWFVIDPQPLDPARVLYVPDQSTARRVAGARDAAEARARLGEGYGPALAEVERAIARYDAVGRRVIAGLDALGEAGIPPDWRSEALTPLHMLPPARRDALADALHAALAPEAAR